MAILQNVAGINKQRRIGNARRRVARRYVDSGGPGGELLGVVVHIQRVIGRRSAARLAVGSRKDADMVGQRPGLACRRVDRWNVGKPALVRRRHALAVVLRRRPRRRVAADGRRPERAARVDNRVRRSRYRVSRHAAVGHAGKRAIGRLIRQRVVGVVRQQDQVHVRAGDYRLGNLEPLVDTGIVSSRFRRGVICMGVIEPVHVPRRDCPIRIDRNVPEEVRII